MVLFFQFQLKCTPANLKQTFWADLVSPTYGETRSKINFFQNISQIWGTKTPHVFIEKIVQLIRFLSYSLKLWLE